MLNLITSIRVIIIGLALPNSTIVGIKMPLIKYYLPAITRKKCKKCEDRYIGISLLIADNQLAEFYTLAPLIKHVQYDKACIYMLMYYKGNNSYCVCY